jgi:hypothetical protein
MNHFLSEIFNFINVSESSLIKATILLLIGSVISIWIRAIVLAFLKKIRFNNALDRIGFNESIQKMKFNIQVEKFIAFIVQVFFIFLFLMFICETLNLATLSHIITKIILYYPNIFISLVIFIISIFAIDIIQKTVIGTKTFKTITYSRFLTKIIDWSIRVLTFLAILYQLQIIPQLIVVMFMGFVGVISLSLGISLGLAAKKPMIRWLKEFNDNFKFF